jgi:hypothetical protein
MGVRKCRKPIGVAKNGTDRGLCNREAGHGKARHSNGTCPRCGVKLTTDNCSSLKTSIRLGWNSGTCKPCAAHRRLERLGVKARRLQAPGKWWVFPCGCAGFLPKDKCSNKLACSSGERGGKRESCVCRIRRILGQSVYTAKRGNYKPMDQNTPHSVIRELMNNNICVLRGEKLTWIFENGKTPHLHHDHETGKIIGFTHPVCNPLALQNRIFELEAEVAFLKAA